jgi:hypothetical protein
LYQYNGIIVSSIQTDSPSEGIRGRILVTQLVGVLCENRNKVVLLSDRMLTTADQSLAFEHEAKCEIVASNALVLTAGTIHEPELITDAKNEIKGKASLFEIAECLSKHYRAVRRKRIEHEILEEMGILSFDEFYHMQDRLHDSMILQLSDRIRKYDLGVALVLGGVDEIAHLYRIIEPGTYSSFDQLGFCCVGSGDRHAEPVFAFYRFSPTLSATEALQIGFEAKKRGEMAGGVGRETDAWIIDNGGIYGVHSDTIRLLESAHAQQESFARFSQTIELKTIKLEYAGS